MKKITLLTFLFISLNGLAQNELIYTYLSYGAAMPNQAAIKNNIKSAEIESGAVFNAGGVFHFGKIGFSSKYSYTGLKNSFYTITDKEFNRWNTHSFMIGPSFQTSIGKSYVNLQLNAGRNWLRKNELNKGRNLIVNPEINTFIYLEKSLFLHFSAGYQWINKNINSTKITYVDIDSKPTNVIIEYNIIDKISLSNYYFSMGIGFKIPVNKNKSHQDSNIINSQKKNDVKRPSNRREGGL